MSLLVLSKKLPCSAQHVRLLRELVQWLNLLEILEVLRALVLAPAFEVSSLVVSLLSGLELVLDVEEFRVVKQFVGFEFVAEQEPPATFLCRALGQGEFLHEVRLVMD